MAETGAGAPCGVPSAAHGVARAPEGAPPTAYYIRPVLFAVVVVLLTYLAWEVRQVFLLVFGAFILSTVLQSAACRIRQFTRLPYRLALGVTVLLIILLVAGGGWLLGGKLSDQFAELPERLPAAAEATRGWLASHRIGQMILTALDSLRDGEAPWERLRSAAGLTVGAVANVFLLLVMAVYLAFDPDLYRDGLVRLVPVARRRQVRDALVAVSDGLLSWLLGQGISMLFVGFATAIGLALLGSPLALSLGVLAGLTSFNPFFGPIVSGTLATGLAFAEGPQTALYVALLMLAIQQIEGDVLMPFVQRWAVALPPVLGVVSIVVFGSLFGVMGVIFATPLMVVVMVLVNKLYVRDALEANSSTPAERPAS